MEIIILSLVVVYFVLGEVFSKQFIKSQLKDQELPEWKKSSNEILLKKFSPFKMMVKSSLAALGEVGQGVKQLSLGLFYLAFRVVLWVLWPLQAVLSVKELGKK